MSLGKEDIALLSKPFDRKTLGVKVQSFNKERTKALLVCYLQHTDVAARLDEVDPAWSATVTDEKVVNQTFIVRTRLTVKGVSRENVGEGDDAKSAHSDSLKRAAMLFGIGRYLYDTPTVWVPYNDQTDRFRSWTLDDFEKYQRGDTDRVPTSPLPMAAKGAAPAPRPQAIAPSAAGPDDDVAAKMNRAQLNVAIAGIQTELGLSDDVLLSWVRDDFKKEPKAMTDADLRRLLSTLQGELGRKGA
jgi:hypothetical protein